MVADIVYSAWAASEARVKTGMFLDNLHGNLRPEYSRPATPALDEHVEKFVWQALMLSHIAKGHSFSYNESGVVNTATRLGAATHYLEKINPTNRGAFYGSLAELPITDMFGVDDCDDINALRYALDGLEQNCTVQNRWMEFALDCIRGGYPWERYGMRRDSYSDLLADSISPNIDVNFSEISSSAKQQEEFDERFRQVSKHLGRLYCGEVITQDMMRDIRKLGGIEFAIGLGAHLAVQDTTAKIQRVGRDAVSRVRKRFGLGRS
ncbi:TPA: hypothetical protein HA278_06020 [Candidatus Woesearchaeota archaeon]|nr:hypothetical protein [Candidatus Woesearchaeota archaeon]